MDDNSTDVTESVSNAIRSRRSPGIWALLAVLLILNFWYDYDHPLGIFFDVIIGIALLLRWSKS